MEKIIKDKFKNNIKLTIEEKYILKNLLDMNKKRVKYNELNEEQKTKIRTDSKNWVLKNRVRHLEIQSKSYYNNREKRLEYQKQYDSNKKK